MTDRLLRVVVGEGRSWARLRCEQPLMLALCLAYRSVRYGTEMARQPMSTSLSMRQAGCWTRPDLRF